MSALKEAQMGMAAHLRDPATHPAPAGIEERRLQIYRDLIYNNIERFISSGFPVLRTLYDAAQWEELVRGFMDTHRCQSPYFLEISQEFIHYLMHEHRLRDCDPPFLVELAHYEWAELALDVAQEELPPVRQPTDLPGAVLCLSPLVWVLSYRYPVHQIGARFRPQEPGDPTFLAVYRNRDDQVKFMALNAASARLLELLRDNVDLNVVEVLDALATELQMAPDTVRQFGLQQVQEMLELSVVLPVG